MATACGLIAISSPCTAADVRDMMAGLLSIQHRGPDTWGIACLNEGTVVGQSHVGRVPEGRAPSNSFPINLGIGHVGLRANQREEEAVPSTTGAHELTRLLQPVLQRSHRGDFAVAFNGRLGPIRHMGREGVSKGRNLNDIERLTNAICKHTSKSWLEVVHAIAASCLAAYTFVVLTSEGVYYARDVNGYRPLSMTQCLVGKERLAVAISSEQIAGTEATQFLERTAGAEGLKREHRYIAAGTLGHLRLDGSWKEWCISPAECRSASLGASQRGFGLSLKRRCSLEAIHFMRGGGQFDELVIDYFREECGRLLAQEEGARVPSNLTVVVGCPRSGISAGRGYAAASGIPYVQALKVSAKVSRGRSHSVQLTEGTAKTIVVRRKKSVPKLQTTQSLAGMRVILVDDLIVQPQGIKAAIALLKEAGAAKVDLRIASPQIVTNCSWGTRFPDIEDLASRPSGHSKFTSPPQPPLADTGAHSVKYLSRAGFMELIGSGFCDHCFLQP